MRTRAIVALVPLLLLGALCAAAPELRHRKFVAGTKITLKARQAKYFLGENVLLDYRIEYNGAGALNVSASTGLGSPDCTVVLLDAKGKKAPGSTREFHYTGHGGTFLRRGYSESFTIPLSFYCRLEKPGKYRIRAAHNLGWTDQSVAIAEDDPRWVETTIEIIMPDDTQARKVVERMLEVQPDVTLYLRAYCTWDTRDYADFACLRYPVYLPILEKIAAEADGDRRALLGIAHNPTPEATQALLRLLKTVDKDRLKRITAALCDRIPEPKGVNRPERRNPIQWLLEPLEHSGKDMVWMRLDADPKLVKPSWRDEFAIPLRQFARKALADDDLEFVRCAAYVLEAIGVQEDVPDLVAAVNRLVPMAERAKPPYHIGESALVRETCREATHAVEAMAARGIDPKADPQTPGEIIHFASAIKQRKDFRPKRWEKQCQDWIRSETPYVREFILFNRPRPLPDSLLDSYRDGTRKVIATTRDGATIHVGVRNALELEVPVDELLGMLVDRLDSERGSLWYGHLYSCLADLLKTGKHEQAYAAQVKAPDKMRMVAIKAGWHRFLKDQGPAIRNGKRFDWNQFHRLMDPDSDDSR